MTNAKRSKRLSHAMSAVLRHRAGQLGLSMDSAGWVAIDEVCRQVRASRGEIFDVVNTNNKARFQVDGDRIRASQGHSIDGMPVTRDALEASWSVFDRDTSIWHGTRVEVVDSIARAGIVCGGRTHVHLAEATDSRVGKRANVALILEVSPVALRSAGYGIFKSQNGVILARHVPPSCIVDIACVSRRSRERAPALRAAFGLRS